MPDPDLQSHDEPSAETRLALAYTPPGLRDGLATILQLDRRLARIVSATTEPMLGQLRLAWWREALERPPEERPRGDVVLDGIGEHLRGHEAALIRLVDGWEHLLSVGPLTREDARSFADGRSAALLSIFGTAPWPERQRRAAGEAAQCWALADLAAKVLNEGERDMLVSLGLEVGPGNSELPRTARGLAVLRALSRRALERGGKPLMEGRSAALAAMRAGLLGR